MIHTFNNFLPVLRLTISFIDGIISSRHVQGVFTVCVRWCMLVCACVLCLFD